MNFTPYLYLRRARNGYDKSLTLLSASPRRMANVLNAAEQEQAKYRHRGKRIHVSLVMGPVIGLRKGPPMTCEICDTATATMWVVGPSELLPSCDDCGHQLGYKVLAPLEPSSTSS